MSETAIRKGDERVREAAEAVSLRDLVLIVVPLCFVTFIVYHFAIESGAFLRLMIVTTAGFVVHYFLPLRYRLRFFLGLSLLAIVLLLGAGAASWLIGLSLALIGVAHLPVPFWVRVVLLLAVGAVFAALRTEWLPLPWPTAIWPILGSMFMFRMAAYLYDVRHQPSLAGGWRMFSYFFLLPNVCFPLFPVVDYAGFCKQYYNDERHRIYRVGVQWIFRGVVQLILYRVV
jgi:hypothetical protein